MDVDQPPKPEDPDYTAAQHKRPRAESESSTSPEGSITSTRTLKSEDLDIVIENDRTYGNQTFHLPCDQAEQDRLAIQHQVFLHALKGKLTTLTLTPAIRRILDLGTGPGNWAVAIAQQFPHADVVGVDMAVWDLETTESDSGNARVTWEIDDLDVWGVESDVDDLSSRLERYDPYSDITVRNPIDALSRHRPKDSLQPQSQPLTPSAAEPSPSFNPYVLEPEPPQPGWNFSHPFDYIHLRNMKGSFAYWEEVYAEIYKNLRPGGYVEVADYELLIPEVLNMTRQSDAPGESSSTAIPPSSSSGDFTLPTVRSLYLSMIRASFKSGRPLGTFYMHPTYLEDTGFKDVRTTYVNVPIGQWPEDEEQKKIGKMFFVVVMEGMETNLLRLMTRWGDGNEIWTKEQVKEKIELARKEVLEWMDGMGKRDDGTKVGWTASFKWVVGRKSKNA